MQHNEAVYRTGATPKPEAPLPEPSFSPAPKILDLHPARECLLESFLSRENLARALTRVERNAGASGPDGVTTRELRPWLHAHWPEVREKLNAGTYRPSPVRRVEIPKPGGGVRLLGVSTVPDRLLQQALLQVLTPLFDPLFCGASFGFRPGRSAHQAVRCLRDGVTRSSATPTTS
jgi:RNA-directed DNA polymerase